MNYMGYTSLPGHDPYFVDLESEEGYRLAQMAAGIFGHVVTEGEAEGLRLSCLSDKPLSPEVVEAVLVEAALALRGESVVPIKNRA